jgi:histidinol-phosphate phosphatase family protein
MLNNHDILAFVVTNQSHISKGYFTYEDYEKKIEELKIELDQRDARLDGIYCCPHTKADNCKCMKPLPGMILQAAKDFDIDISSSYIIGDMGMSDMVLAKNIGAKGILVRTGVGEGSLTGSL